MDHDAILSSLFSENEALRIMTDDSPRFEGSVPMINGQPLFHRDHSNLTPFKITPRLLRLFNLPTTINADIKNGKRFRSARPLTMHIMKPSEYKIKIINPHELLFPVIDAAIASGYNVEVITRPDINKDPDESCTKDIVEGESVFKRLRRDLGESSETLADNSNPAADSSVADVASSDDLRQPIETLVENLNLAASSSATGTSSNT